MLKLLSCIDKLLTEKVNRLCAVNNNSTIQQFIIIYTFCSFQDAIFSLHPGQADHCNTGNRPLK